MLFRRQNRYRLSGYFFAISATALWSGNFIIARGLSESIPPVSLAFYRWVVAVIVFLPFALKPLIREWECLRAHLPYLSMTALLGITLFNTLIYFAGHTTTALNLSLISITFPIFIVILSRIIYGERVTAVKSIGIVMVGAGVILLITRGNISRLLNISFAVGDVWMLVAAIIFAIYSIVLKHKPEQLSIWAFQLSTFILGLVFLLPFFIWERGSGHPFLRRSYRHFPFLQRTAHCSRYTDSKLWPKVSVSNSIIPKPVGQRRKQNARFPGFRQPYNWNCADSANLV